MDGVQMLLAAIVHDPTDHDARLALADSLEETGRQEQAELARLHARQLMGVGTPEEQERLRSLLAEGVKPVVPKMENGIGMRFVLVPAGTFLMGSPDDEADRNSNEGPQHQVTITKAFWLGAYQVTQAEYQRVMGKNPSYFSASGGGKDSVKGMDTSRFPVENVSWEDAQAFLKKLNAMAEEAKKGLKYRLPSDAEWEYSTRSGYFFKNKKSAPFHFGDSLSSTQANFDGNYPYGGAPKGPYLERTCAVGSYQPNAFGLYDMHGNVWEWCSDWYDENYYKSSPPHDPPGPSDGSGRVFRGGSWYDGGQHCRAADRSRDAPSCRCRYIGFRVAAPLVEQGE